MTTVEDRPVTEFEDNDQKPVGYGRMLRKEDPRFVRGRGHYIDDVQLKGMLHLASLRAPIQPDRAAYDPDLPRTVHASLNALSALCDPASITS